MGSHTCDACALLTHGVLRGRNWICVAAGTTPRALPRAMLHKQANYPSTIRYGGVADPPLRLRLKLLSDVVDRLE